MGEIINIDFGANESNPAKKPSGDVKKEFPGPEEVDKILVSAIFHGAKMIECLRGLGGYVSGEAKEQAEQVVADYDKLETAKLILASNEQDWKAKPAFFYALGMHFMDKAKLKASRDFISVFKPEDNGSEE